MFALSREPISAAGLKRGLCDPRAGGYVEFEGWVRNHNEGQSVAELEYEAYEALALKEGERIIREALARFDVLAIHCVHRVGRLAIGDCAVWVGVSAPHRGPAFEACRYVIDEVKARVPIWKKERLAGGDQVWINAPATADSEASR